MIVQHSIKIGLAAYKALTARLEEGQTYDDVIRELLQLDSDAEPEPPRPFAHIDEVSSGFVRGFVGPAGGFHSRGLWLPNGTELRARYKQQLYQARIEDGKWIDFDGNEHSSPSAAANAVTATTVNGLRFWEGKRPTDGGWRRLEAFVPNKL